MDNYQINDIKRLALNYLARYSCSKLKLRNFLIKKLNLKAMVVDNQEKSIILDKIDSVVEYMVSLGYINDDSYAKLQFNSLLNKGKSVIQMNYKFMEKGLDKSYLDQNINQYHKDDLEILLATKFIKKKSLGCYYKKLNEQDMEKSMAIMYRNGFNYDTIKKVLHFDIQEADEILFNKLI